ncbi:ATP-binding protein [Bradyrhizobium altum]|uniref:ATP-binding protein n=1 Tax=Bradyrhizobium altum TaxID=1571202 RepID=UPI001E4A2E63|nr:ATP-binding protein [Bradyrhizobium altum]
MLTHPTFDRLNALGLHGMAKAFVDIEATGEAASIGHAEWLASLLEHEVSLRHDKRLNEESMGDDARKFSGTGNPTRLLTAIDHLRTFGRRARSQSALSRRRGSRQRVQKRSSDKYRDQLCGYFDQFQ